MARVERKELEGVLGATTLTTLYYLIAKALGRPAALLAIRDLLGLFQVAAVDHQVLARAADSPLKDFEDAVLSEAGLAAGVGAVVTRDPEGFRASRLLVLSP